MVLQSTTQRRAIRPIVLLCLVAVGFALRLHGLGRESLWYDELLQLDIAQLPLPDMFGRLRGHTAVPLDYLVAHFWVGFGRSEFWVRLPAALAGTLTLPLVYRLGRALLGPGPGLLQAALLTVSPFHLRYSQEARPYALLLLGITLAAYAFWRLRATGHWRYGLLLQTGVLGAWLAHIFAVAVWAALLGFAALDALAGRQKPRRAAVALALSGALPVVLLLAMGWAGVLFYSAKGFGGALVDPRQFSQEAGQKPNRGTGPAVDWPFIRAEILMPLTGQPGPAGLLLFGGLAVGGWLRLLRQRKFRLALLLGLWLALPPALIVTFLAYRGTFFASRYIIGVLPAYLALVAAGLDGLSYFKNNHLAAVTAVMAATAVAVLSVGGLAGYYRGNPREDWRLAAAFIAQNAEPTDAVIAFHAEPAMNWYYPPAAAPPGFYNSLFTVQQTVAGARRGWVILSIFSSDVDSRLRAWLAEQQAVRLVFEPRLHVYYLGAGVSHQQLLADIQNFALPVNHQLYASLARENRRRPVVARRYYDLAIAHAPDEATRAAYEAARAALRP